MCSTEVELHADLLLLLLLVVFFLTKGATPNPKNLSNCNKHTRTSNPKKRVKLQTQTLGKESA
jgi:hypothetical protein